MIKRKDGAYIGYDTLLGMYQDSQNKLKQACDKATKLQQENDAIKLELLKFRITVAIDSIPQDITKDVG